MRDLAVTLIVFGSLPFILKRPYIGILMWVWISVMNPHRESWGFATTFPFAAIIAATTLLSLVLTKDRKGLPITPITLVLIAFIFWMNVSTVFAIHPDQVYGNWNRVIKIMLMTVVTLMLLKTRRHIELLIIVLVFSLGFFGVKGGIFTVMSGGQYRVWGPADTFIGGNNEIALALIMVIPLMHYLQIMTEKKWIRHGLTIAILLCAFAALGSYSRGALLAIAAMAGFLWLKSSKKLVLGMLMVISIPILVAFMPDQWTERMDTISTYKEDSSAMGRINAWMMAYNLAKDRPLVGGGFEIYDLEVFGRYAPIPTDVHAAHSIYFQALGEHGFVGLGLYLLLGFLTWRCGSWIVRHTRKREDLKWAYHLAAMVQVSLIGFAVGGAFLSLLYFDVPYYLMAALVLTRRVIEEQLKSEARLAGSTFADIARQDVPALTPTASKTLQ
ncbi:MAG TPA: putative O-glycosylation ligase, exosortase A system-associated [Noviherbaspirillum sp.]|jgi:probable O-glycosylation ligase (exosortase A-associated)|uniref:putative O-glycosylation ligase, exosortase A system-associated n=1 Tax=Noviherbaspirillum sp. TaxID=1926288 RepID=UPI002DDCBCA9|nr:putative O-glycosylation ligase, exosortase A system-associated [Noviherbaspirillum sp.]HEV2608910.1 putative O-glycosylation ligase, exosortase A system-associated [Noviherbaspirillum sp.]